MTVTHFREHADGGAAFPHTPDRTTPTGVGDMFVFKPGDAPGMSLRDYFAAKALVALAQGDTYSRGAICKRLGLSSEQFEADPDGFYVQMLAANAYDHADAMLKARQGGAASAEPDLLVALCELAEVAERCDSWQSFPADALEKARAAIAKATGSAA